MFILRHTPWMCKASKARESGLAFGARVVLDPENRRRICRNLGQHLKFMPRFRDSPEVPDARGSIVKVDISPKAWFRFCLGTRARTKVR
jgi:hypothetical protein